jgi:energy-converting hydrogenase Eha subunit A
MEVSIESLIISSIIVALFMGVPIGFLIKKLSVRNSILLSIITAIVAIGGCLLGDMLNMIKYYKAIDIMSSIRAIPFLWKDTSEGGMIIRVTILLISILAIFIVARAKKPIVEI